VFQGSYLHVIMSMQRCIYVDPIYYLFISELFQCSLHYVFLLVKLPLCFKGLFNHLRAMYLLYH
jgi:hypothetical protein